MRSFFPDPSFAWTFYLVLVALMAAAAYVDLRTLVIPKPLTLSTLGLGVVFNLVRGVWAGIEEQEFWVLGENGPIVGGLDGLLWTLAGFATGFGLFFIMWFLGTCGGGDVKLFAALGAWIGPVLTIWVLGATLVLVIGIALLRLAKSLIFRGRQATMKAYSVKAAPKVGKKAGKQGLAQSRQTRQRLTPYSLPVALSTAALLLWFLGKDLGLPYYSGWTEDNKTKTNQPR
jgi:prepilin peptidase CpaA